MLIDRNELDFLIYHGKMAFNDDEKQILEHLKNCDRLMLLDSCKRDCLFEAIKSQKLKKGFLTRH